MLVDELLPVGLLDRGDGREGRLGDRLERPLPSFVSALPGSEKVTSTERPSSATVLARCSGFSGLSVSSTPSMVSRRSTTSSVTAVTSGLSALMSPLPWISTRSLMSSG